MNSAGVREPTINNRETKFQKKEYSKNKVF